MLTPSDGAHGHRLFILFLDKLFSDLAIDTVIDPKVELIERRVTKPYRFQTRENHCFDGVVVVVVVVDVDVGGGGGSCLREKRKVVVHLADYQ